MRLAIVVHSLHLFHTCSLYLHVCRAKTRHTSEDSEGMATRSREREKGTRADGASGEVQRRSPVPVRRSKRLLTKKT